MYIMVDSIIMCTVIGKSAYKISRNSVLTCEFGKQHASCKEPGHMLTKKHN